MTELIILKTLKPITKRRQRSAIKGPSKWVAKAKETDVELDPAAPSTLFAIEDARRVIAHVHSLFESGLMRESGFLVWLEEGDKILQDLSLAIAEKKFNNLEDGFQWETVEEISYIDYHFFDHRWDDGDWYNQDNDVDFDSPAIELLVKQAGYWVEVIVQRASNVFHLAINADDWEFFASVSDSLNRISRIGRESLFSDGNDPRFK